MAGVLAVAAILAGCSDDVSSGSSEFNRLQEERSASRLARVDSASAAFLEHFEQVGSATLDLSGDSVTVRPERCALTPEGDVYLGADDSPQVLLWRRNTAEAHPVAISSRDAPWRIGDLFWDPEDETLYVLDSGRHQVRRYGAYGSLRGLAALVGGQTTFALVVTRSGELITGGVREERPGRTTMVSVHAPDGRQRRAFFEMDSAMSTSKLRAAPPVLLTLGGDERFYAAESTSSLIHLHEPDGSWVATVDVGFDGYRAPVPLQDVRFDFARADAWTRSWDRLVFLHAGNELLFTAFQRWRGSSPAYRVEVRTRTGDMQSTGLWHDSMPICGRGEEIVLVSQGDLRRAEISRWRYRSQVPVDLRRER